MERKALEKLWDSNVWDNILSCSEQNFIELIVNLSYEEGIMQGLKRAESISIEVINKVMEQ